MKNLFLSELRRFRKVAAIVAVLHFLVLVFIGRTDNMLQQPFFASMPLFGVCMLLGLALAIWQVGSYRKPSQWLWLVHRPLPPERIFAALALSALALLTLVILLPQLAYVAGLDVFTTQVVDLRHYLMLVHVLAFALMAWLAGCHAMVSRHKAAIAVLAAPVLLGLHLVSVWSLLLPVLTCLAWLGYIAMRSFRADRDAPLKSNFALLMTALPLQLGFFLLAFSVGKAAFVSGSVLLGVDPLNTDYPPEGGLIEVERATPGKAISLGLTASHDARAASWRDQLPLLEPIESGPWLTRYPIRHQLGNLPVSTQWEDADRGIFWTFSHDRMLFHGRDPKSGADKGWWGVAGAGDTQPFAEVPLANGDGMLMTRSTLYAIDEDNQALHAVLQLPDNETFVNVPMQQFNRTLVLTDRHLAAYRSDRQTTSPYAPLLLDWQLDLPGGPVQLERVLVAQMMDGWLVSLVFGDGFRQIGFTQINHFKQPWQEVVHVDNDGDTQVVARRDLDADYPAIYQESWWFSPPLNMLSEWPESALDKGLTWPLEMEIRPSVPLLYPIAAVGMLLSLGLCLWWLRGTNVAPARRRMWLASCAVLGLPAFLSMICLEPRRCGG